MHNIQIARDQETRDIAAGRKPVAVDPDGTRHYTNGVNTWTQNPIKGSGDNKGKY